MLERQVEKKNDNLLTLLFSQVQKFGSNRHIDRRFIHKNNKLKIS